MCIRDRDEGGIPTYLAGNEIQLGDKESIEDTARVLGRMFDGIEFRGFERAFVTPKAILVLWTARLVISGNSILLSMLRSHH